MKILHTEASPGWGGQEIRIMEEALGMRKRGHELFFIVQKKGHLAKEARKNGFAVYEMDFKKSKALFILLFLLWFLKRKQIDVLNTHSSLDAWLGGIAAKIAGAPVIRTRHLSTPVRPGKKCYLLYNRLADRVVTTCAETAYLLQKMAKIPVSRITSIPTGVNPEKLHFCPKKAESFRTQLGIQPHDCLVGTLCVLRGWKGVLDLLEAAKLMEDFPDIKWVVIGSGPSEEYFLRERARLKLEKKVIFTGYLSPPYDALAAVDIFVLLSHAHEGVSQASLQAAFLQKPLITTPIGGLKEVCLEGITGFQVAPHQPQTVADAVKKLATNPILRQTFGEAAKKLVLEKFTFEETLCQMELLYTVAIDT